MKENLELVEPTPIKTFDITYNEEYTTPLVGKGITTGARLELVKSFVGATQYEASAWCKTVGLTCEFETTTDYQTAGLIVNQSAHQNELVKSLSKMTFYISDGKGTKPTTPSTNNNTPEDKENTNTENKDNKEDNKEEESSNTSTEDNQKK
jgi:beta-lactam-binding protein with PASTA domain